ncbi:hypothetical protein [Streptomyces sp.]|uniref:hypothetical protein n=1 Tax=Streptomyces sp. TaxID=1931 RepID=UPI0028120451|nr:hypothetical protein [Streptomyces sp.]
MSDLSTLRLDFRHAHSLVDPAEEGVQTWQISLLADDQPVARKRATRGQYWKAHNLGERMADEPSLASSDILFQDHDVLMLFDDSLDGIEDPAGDLYQSMGMVNLAPQDWFVPFDSEQARDPARGFRHP